MDNIRHLKASGQMEYHLDNIENLQLLAELVDDADIIVHLAAAVGVKLIVESPVRTIETNVNSSSPPPRPKCTARTPMSPFTKTRIWSSAQQQRAAGAMPPPKPSMNFLRCRTGRKKSYPSSSSAFSTPSGLARPAATAWSCRIS